jgi:RNA polymerase sigma factor (TIGR02999 family)
MDVPPAGEITRLLNRVRSGQDRDHLANLVYAELRKIAGHIMRSERTSHTLQATLLANDALLDLIDQNRQWENRTHFFAVAAHAMRRMLVDHSRRKGTRKRGGDVRHTELEEIPVLPVIDRDLILALDQALTRLETMDPRLARIVELRYFGGLTEEETSEVLQISPRTIKREWSFARAWLYAELSRPPHPQQA